MTKDVNRKNWSVYIVECKDKRLYTGITDNLERRIKQHNRGRGCRFTKFRLPVKLVFREKSVSKGLALKREAEIKGWTRKRKLELISSKSKALREGSLSATKN